MSEPSSNAPDIAIIGAGPAGLMAAETVARQMSGTGVKVTVYDRMPAVGRKFLLAGRGGLNLTHSEALDILLTRYGSAMPDLASAIRAFPPQALRDWCEGLGQETFVGSSGRIFPKSFKASPLLRAWLGRLRYLGVQFALRHEWRGFEKENALIFATPEGLFRVEAQACVLALGGASWPRLGSDGAWVPVLEKAGLAVVPLQPANCGFLVPWSEHFLARFEGAPLKNLRLSCRDHLGVEQASLGEVTITHTGLEGGGLYALGRFLREDFLNNGEAWLTLSLRPDLTVEEITRRLAGRSPKQSLSTFLRKSLRLSPASIGLLNEACGMLGEKPVSLTPERLASRIHALPLRLTGMAPIAKAISTAGGVALSELDENFMLRRRSGLFIAGEMLDWEAPTGGYLLQACFATGRRAGEGVVNWLGRMA